MFYQLQETHTEHAETARAAWESYTQTTSELLQAQCWSRKQAPERLVNILARRSIRFSNRLRQLLPGHALIG